jgi:hypothetical protein
MQRSEQPASLNARALALLQRFASSGGHLAPKDEYDHRGVCCHRRHWTGGERVQDGSGFRMAGQTLDGTCADSCVEWQAVVAELTAAVDAEPRLQPQLLEVAS